jgi:tetratricopeptide (TPR) repeat protein
MNEDFDKNYDDELVNRYEDMLAKGNAYFFDIDQFEDLIDHYCLHNKFKHALEVIDYGYSLFRDNTTLMLRESQILAGMGHLSKALSILKVLEKMEGHNEEVLLTMASIYSQSHEHLKAIVLLRKALEMGNSEFQAEIILEIALEYENLERFDKAIQVLRQAIEQFPSNETFLYEIAYCYDMAERTAECIEYYHQFLEKYPYSFPAWYNLGNAFQKLEQYEEALEAYDFCIAIQDDFTPAYFNKAQTLFKMDRFQDAIHTFEETYTFEPPHAAVYCHIGECFEKLNQLDKALFYYRKSIQLDEHFADAYLGVGIVLDMQENVLEAMQYVERAIQLDEENVDYPIFLVEMLKKQERWEEAEAILTPLMTKHRDNEDVWMEYADLLYLRDDVRGALATTRQANHAFPTCTELKFRLLAYLYIAGQQTEAEELLVRLVIESPEGLDDFVEYFPEIRSYPLFIELTRNKFF